MGEGKYGSEVWMFDDNGLGNESRLLIVAVDEDAQAAKIIWEYRLGSHAKIYGDCDPLPSGNVYGSYWRYNYGGDDESQSGVVEVTRDTQRTAWQLKIYGKACPRGGDRLCSVNYLVEGWMMYSVERFFETPLLPSADAGRTGPSAPPTCKNGALEFTVFNSYKESSEKRGAFTLTWTDGETDETLAASGSFKFSPHWRPTSVEAQVTSEVRLTTRSAELVIENVRGVTIRYDVECTYDYSR